MAVKTRLNTDEHNGLENTDDLDAVYANGLKEGELGDELLSQFLNISKELDKKKEEK